MFKKRLYFMVIMIILLSMFTACSSSGELKGTYYAANSSLFSGPQFSSITFSSNNRMSMSAMGIVGTEGTYKLTGGSIELSYKEPSLMVEGKAVVKTMTFERSGKSIFLDGYEFVKE